MNITNNNNEKMTVKELIERLQNMPQDAPVGKLGCGREEGTFTFAPLIAAVYFDSPLKQGKDEPDICGAVVLAA